MLLNYVKKLQLQEEDNEMQLPFTKTKVVE
jgi:hypothetical protein